MRLARSHPEYKRNVTRVPSEYTGVRFCPKLKLWRAKIKVAGINYVLGYFEHEAQAGAAYQQARSDVNAGVATFLKPSPNPVTPEN